jgi:hypothetical protein
MVKTVETEKLRCPRPPELRTRATQSMPVRMHMTSTPTGSIETGNKLGARPVIRQSQVYRETMSGNAVKDLMGQSSILWSTQEQEGVFRGMAVHKMEADLPGIYQASRGESGESAHGQGWRRKLAPHTLQCEPSTDYVMDTYPNPGCRATCDGCGSVVTSFLHCADCCESNLFDLCERCYVGLYEQRGAPLDLARLRKVPRAHPIHNMAEHRMVPVKPP